MPQKPKAKRPPDELEKGTVEEVTIVDDQNERGYYYDDAHGYEIYKSDEDDEEDVDPNLKGCRQ